MGRYDGYLIASDFDGTIARGGIISEENRAAISTFIKGGGRFCVASGRTPGFLTEKCSGLGLNAPVMALGGGVLADPESGEILYRRTLPKDACSALMHIVPVCTGISGISVIGRGEDFFGKSFAPGELTETDLNGMLPGAEIYKFLLVFDTEDHALRARDDCRALFGGGFLFERSWATGLEMLPENSGKGSALAALTDLLQPRAKRVIGIGDYENDISLLTAADEGIAVSNAAEEVKKAAGRVLKSDWSASMAELISLLPPL